MALILAVSIRLACNRSKKINTLATFSDEDASFYHIQPVLPQQN